MPEAFRPASVTGFLSAKRLPIIDAFGRCRRDAEIIRLIVGAAVVQRFP